MSRFIIAAVAPMVIFCAGFMLLNPMDKPAIFLTNSLGKMLFPRLDSYRRHRKLVALAGIILVIIFTAGITAYGIKIANRLPHS